MTWPAAQVLPAVQALARPVLLDYFAPSSCVAATRIGIDVLAAFGITAIPVPVRLQVINAAMLDLDEPPSQPVPAHSRGGPWCVEVGADQDRAIGHVAIGVAAQVATSSRWLLDLAIDQTHRPHKNIYLTEPLLWAGVAEGLLTTPGHHEARHGPHGIVVAYRRTAEHPYRASVNWRRRITGPGGPAVFREATARIITATRAHLNST